MNTKLSVGGRTIIVAAEKITKNEVDKALAEGKTHVKFTNNKVQRRLLKEQARIRRQQEIRENKYKAAQKAAADTRRAIPGGGIGLLRKEPEVTRAKGTAHFIDKSGKHIPVPVDQVEDITTAFEAQPIREEQAEEEDLSGAAGPEYRYLQQDEEWEPMDTAPRDGTLIQLRGKWKATDPGEPFVVEGKYDVGGFTQGWETENGTWFCPEAWKPIVEEVDLPMSTCGMGLHPDDGVKLIPGAGIDAEKMSAEEFEAGLSAHGFSPAADSIMAEHLDPSGINPFELNIQPGQGRAQMFASHLAATAKVEETQLFQPGLAAAVTATARENMETVRDSLGVAEGSGLESITKPDNSTEQ